ncbi:unnamed protein product, partial [Sphacelaria rigidula]
RSPGFLTLSVADNIEPKLWWLRDKLEMTLEDAGKLVGNYPNLLSLSIEESLEPKLCIDDNLAPTIDFFEQEMGAVEVS